MTPKAFAIRCLNCRLGADRHHWTSRWLSRLVVVLELTSRVLAFQLTQPAFTEYLQLMQPCTIFAARGG